MIQSPGKLGFAMVWPLALALSPRPDGSLPLPIFVVNGRSDPKQGDKDRVLDIIAGVYVVTHKDIVMRCHAESYQTAAWLHPCTANLSLKDTADVVSVFPSRISHIQCMIESRRLT